MTKIVVTGGCGFIGRAFIQTSLATGADSIRVLDNLSVGTREELGEVAGDVEVTDRRDWGDRLALVEGDIRDAEVVRSALEGADAVVHLAANTGVEPSVKDPVFDCDVNVRGTLNVLEACRIQGVRRMVFASSGAPLGVQVPPLHENLAPRPVSPYGASKLAGEGYCSAYFQTFGIETVALRFGNVYGPGSGHKSSVVAKFIKHALSGETLEIYGDGGQTRDFIYIADLIRAIDAALTLPAIGGEVFQIATSAETTVGELADMLVSALADAGVDTPEIIHGEKRLGDVDRNYSDTRKAQTVLGWRAEVGLSEGLKQTVQSFLTPGQEGK
jgi:UDP-glucose 4-epimerase